MPKDVIPIKNVVLCISEIVNSSIFAFYKLIESRNNNTEASTVDLSSSFSAYLVQRKKLRSALDMDPNLFIEFLKKSEIILSRSGYEIHRFNRSISFYWLNFKER